MILGVMQTRALNVIKQSNAVRFSPSVSKTHISPPLQHHPPPPRETGRSDNQLDSICRPNQVSKRPYIFLLQVYTTSLYYLAHWFLLGKMKRRTERTRFLFIFTYFSFTIRRNAARFSHQRHVISLLLFFNSFTPKSKKYHQRLI